MTHVKIWIGNKTDHLDQLQIIINDEQEYSFSPAPEIDLVDFIKWLITEIKLELDYEMTREFGLPITIIDGK